MNMFSQKTFSDYRIYQVTVGELHSNKEYSYKVIAPDPEKAVEVAFSVSKKDWADGAILAATKILLVDNRIQN